MQVWYEAKNLRTIEMFAYLLNREWRRWTVTEDPTVLGFYCVNFHLLWTLWTTNMIECAIQRDSKMNEYSLLFDRDSQVWKTMFRGRNYLVMGECDELWNPDEVKWKWIPDEVNWEWFEYKFACPVWHSCNHSKSETAMKRSDHVVPFMNQMVIGYDARIVATIRLGANRKRGLFSLWDICFPSLLFPFRQCCPTPSCWDLAISCLKTWHTRIVLISFINTAHFTSRRAQQIQHCKYLTLSISVE